MATEQRQMEILKALEQEQRVESARLAARFDVSEDTIRRDLRSLSDAGLIRRIYGGAVPQTPVATTYSGRIGESIEAKHAIVREALKLVKPKQTIFLDGGTTVEALARALPTDLPLNVITHSPPAASALIDKPLVEVVVLGGRLLRDAAVTVGTEVVTGYGRCRADICFLGAASVDAEIGVGVFSHEDAELKRAMIQAAAAVVLLASADKIGTRAPFLIGPVSVVDHLITESSAPSKQLEMIRSACRTVITV
jgi:DeoR/GlpR family transcriptional regulator of sugar metabolism